MKPRTLFALLILLTLLAVGCSSMPATEPPTAEATDTSSPTATEPPTAAPPTATTAVLQESDPAVPIVVTAVDEFTIVLAANVTTGYEWRLMETPDENLVQFVTQEYVADQPITVGSGGLDVWTFQADAPGETTIVFGFYPPGESDTPDNVVTFTVHIQ